MLLLLVAVCGNTAHLMLARERTAAEMARLALGAACGASSGYSPENSCWRLGGAYSAWRRVQQSRRSAQCPDDRPADQLQTHDLAGLAFAAAPGIACGAIVGAAPAAQLRG
jgi:hypothetical protein